MLKEVESIAWQGSVPVEFVMKGDEVTTLDPPPPLHMLIPRLSYLPAGAPREVIEEHFGSSASEAPREIWLEDTSSRQPVQWHLPVGVLQDARSNPEALPWQLTVHFHHFPQHQIIPFEDESAVRAHFMHSMKQAFYLRYGSSEIAMSLPLAEQDGIWRSVLDNTGPVMVLNSNGEPEKRVENINNSNQEAPTDRAIPVRICRTIGSTGWNRSSPFPPLVTYTLRVPIGETTVSQCLDMLDSSDCTTTSGGNEREEDIGSGDTTGNHQCIKDKENQLVIVHGIQVPLDTQLEVLWKCLHYADHFLYLAVLNGDHPAGT
eukprot:471568_1